VKYTVTVEGTEFTVDLTGGRVVVNGREAKAELHAVPGTPLRQLVLDGRSHTLGLERRDDGWMVVDGGEWTEAAVIDERTRLLREMTGGGGRPAGDRTVKAPMPGLVLRVEVAVGEHVTKGHGLVVLEAMKMENEITAQAEGEVKAIHVSAGQAVEKGTPLVELHGEG